MRESALAGTAPGLTTLAANAMTLKKKRPQLACGRESGTAIREEEGVAT